MRKSTELVVAQNHATDFDAAEFDFGNLEIRGRNDTLPYQGTGNRLCRH
jgi:hypothetical protein